MRAVWSFWDSPLAAHYRTMWASEKMHLLSWIVSFETVRRWYPATSLVTDDAGARLLVDGLGLEFDTVSTGLNALRGRDPEWWALGKLYAYRAQTEPFVHVDSDVYLWKPLPEELTRAPLFSQNPEPITLEASYYDPDVLDRALDATGGGWLPEEWTWYRISGVPLRGECCGIFGGSRVDFVRHYAGQAIRMVEDPANQAGWSRLYRKDRYAVLYEQYLLAACVEYHRARPDSPFREVEVAHLFGSMDEAQVDENAERVGYTHLIAGAKQSRELAERLERRVMRDYPERYERCLQHLGELAAV